MKNIFSKKEKKEKPEDKNKQATTQEAKVVHKTLRTLLVFDGNPANDWTKIFPEDYLEDGSLIRVYQCSWNECKVSVFCEKGKPIARCSIAPLHSHEGVIRPQTANIIPDFILIRNQARGPTPNLDNRHTLYGLMMANVPSINTLQSEYMQFERPVMMSVLNEIKMKVGSKKFPFIEANYYPDHTQMVISPEYPAVFKISHAHAGMGKIQVKDSDEFRDLATVLALHGDYCTGEPFIKADYGIRVQRVGKHTRVFKKIFTGSGWKSQFGGSDLQSIEPEQKHIFWADQCQKAFGGLDLFAIDAMHSEKDGDTIIELNGTAIGFHRQYWMEDTLHVKELVLERLNQLFGHSRDINKNQPVLQRANHGESNKHSQEKGKKHPEEKEKKHSEEKEKKHPEEKEKKHSEDKEKKHSEEQEKKHSEEKEKKHSEDKEKKHSEEKKSKKSKKEKAK